MQQPNHELGRSIMAITNSKEAADVSRAAVALFQADRNGDEEGIIEVLGMLGEDVLDGLLVALVVLGNAAFDADSAAGWDAFIGRYLAAIDAGESETT